MGYVDDNLMPGERVVYSTRPHWIVYRWVAPAIAAAVAALIVGASADLPAATGVGAFFLVIVAPLAFLVAWIERKTSEFAVTNKRVIVKVGLIRRQTEEMLLSKVEQLMVDQSIPGRVLKYGTITLHGTGGGGTAFDRVARPIELRKTMYAEIEALSEQQGPHWGGRTLEGL